MEFIKRNKVFVILATVLLVSIVFLLIQFLEPNKSTDANVGGNDNEQAANISNFSLKLTSANDLTFHWGVNQGNESISKVEIFHDITLLKDVTNQAVFSTPLFQSGIKTGNNEFTLKVTLGNGRVLEKRLYRYIDEVLNFQVNQRLEGNILYMETMYFVQKEQKPRTPMVSYTLNQKGVIPLSFVKSETVKDDGDYQQIKDYYTFDLSQVTSGNYIFSLSFNFNDYNLVFKRTVSIDI
ncbi:hypothetical protein A4S06_04340 [Erysipelotrichaceae bacterium MTC7]|nr:hypothetical protein A4S06_04340 [Erysipelotrichaceae bacterium MTC7]